MQAGEQMAMVERALTEAGVRSVAELRARYPDPSDALLTE
jgi:hypothetical protein